MVLVSVQGVLLSVQGVLVNVQDGFRVYRVVLVSVQEGSSKCTGWF